MEMCRAIFKDAVVAAVLIAATICSTMPLAVKAVNSPVYRQSRAVSMLLRQDGVGVAGILGDTRDIDMLIKFAGALTSAYINFELIPVNEARTFVEVFESLPERVDIDGFEYRRKDLHIGGTAESEEDYMAFLKSLRGRNYFSSAAGSSYEASDGGVRFKIICGYAAY